MDRLLLFTTTYRDVEGPFLPEKIHIYSIIDERLSSSSPHVHTALVFPGKK